MEIVAPVGRISRHPYNASVPRVLLPVLAASCLVLPLEIDLEVGRRALPWMPPDLARQVAKRPKDFARGVKAARTWPANFHRSGGDDGVEAAIVAQCERLAAALRAQAPFADVVAGLGALAHLTADLDAPYLDRQTADPHAQAFSSYLRSAYSRIPQVFYGQDLTLTRGPTEGLAFMLRARRSDSRSLAPLISADLDRLGGPANWRALDDRSSSFGAASLTLSHAATDFANLASWVWHHGGGLVSPIVAPPETLLVWSGEPKPREKTSPRLSFRQIRR